MGSDQSTQHAAAQLTESEVSAVVASTHYTADEVHRLHAQFIADVPSGCVSRTQFAVVAACFGFAGSRLEAMMFNAFDSNGDGVISFFEFARGMSTMTRGTNDEKLQFAFDMYDMQRRGYLAKDDVLITLRSMEAAFGSFCGYGTGDLSAVQVNDRMFAAAQRLSAPAFKEFARRNPSVVRGLALSA